MSAGQRTVVAKPGRSDDVLDEAQQIRIYNEVRAQFESLAPKRPIKPDRSEPGAFSDAVSAPDVEVPVPELDKLRSLRNQSQAVFPETNPSEAEEFVETEYYKALDSIDKQHHTTGSGFIKAGMDRNAVNGYELQVNGFHGKQTEMAFKSNPATNDWTPKLEDHQVEFLSSKPDRSEIS
ncbi:uncharacterized protein LOC127258251 [Andrographis paniculata]|uniref:uncharacterized protein LOC127258251 n=1 Tax=Andrographis paniculata TaxID=175694 RepID=UPI0021E7FD2B|nr:uncharacterized protein LOC127258251 [Andrographis paniculata]